MAGQVGNLSYKNKPREQPATLVGKIATRMRDYFFE